MILIRSGDTVIIRRDLLILYIFQAGEFRVEPRDIVPDTIVVSGIFLSQQERWGVLEYMKEGDIQDEAFG